MGYEAKFTVRDLDRYDEGFDYEAEWDAYRDWWFVYHGQKMVGAIRPAVGTYPCRTWALPTPGAPVTGLTQVDDTANLFEAIEAIHAHIGRADAEREAAEALAEDDDDEVEA